MTASQSGSRILVPCGLAVIVGCCWLTISCREHPAPGQRASLVLQQRDARPTAPFSSAAFLEGGHLAVWNSLDPSVLLLGRSDRRIQFAYPPRAIAAEQDGGLSVVLADNTIIRLDRHGNKVDSAFLRARGAIDIRAVEPRWEIFLSILGPAGFRRTYSDGS